MAMTRTRDAARVRRAAKPAVGRPVLFAILLVVAALGMLGLLVAGPTITLPFGIACSAGLMALVAVAWVVAGPRL